MTRTETSPNPRPAVRFPVGPRWGQAAGALSLAVAPVGIDLSGADAGTASVYRCLLAVPVLLLLAPVGALVLGVVVLGERPTLAQWLGCALILVSAYITTGGRAGNGDSVRTEHAGGPTARPRSGHARRRPYRASSMARLSAG